MENNLNNPIQSLWIGGQLSKVELLCIQSFLDHGHAFHLYCYEEIENIPKGTQLYDARCILPEDKIFRFKEGWGKGSVAGFADLFRLLLLQHNGGWWVDMDIICLNPFLFGQETIICSSYEGEYGSLANNCVIKAPKNNYFINYCINELAKTELEKMDFGSAGPFLFQKAIKQLHAKHLIVPYQYFNPISWKFIDELILGKISTVNKLKEYARPVLKPQTMPGRKVGANSYAVHLWNEVWRSNNFDKNAQYDKNCLFEKLKRKHGIK